MISLKDDPYHNPLTSPKRRFNYEYHLALECLLPLLKSWGIDVNGLNVLDVGCGSGGISIAVAEKGARCLGIDHNEERILEAEDMADRYVVNAHFQSADALRLTDCAEPFDLIILSEVLEHLTDLLNVEKMLAWCRRQLTSEGKIYVSFPPWYSPFAGHQAGWPRIRYIPWYHLLPEQLKYFLVPFNTCRYLKFAQELNGLTIKSFVSIVRQVGLFTERSALYHLRPEYHWRYGVPTIKAPQIVGEMPIIREFVISGAFYLLGIASN
jgi:2-polyprenyl-3-methyl-5-hydroxy-6-metoxy-1,4-benzoquinol methylase